MHNSIAFSGSRIGYVVFSGFDVICSCFRAYHCQHNFIPADYLPSFLDLVVWGHEHQAITEPDYVAVNDFVQDEDDEEGTMEKGFYIYQPGSSVATSLSEGEVPRK